MRRRFVLERIWSKLKKNGDGGGFGELSAEVKEGGR